jgi:hypothetical protein
VAACHFCDELTTVEGAAEVFEVTAERQQVGSARALPSNPRSSGSASRYRP